MMMIVTTMKIREKLVDWVLLLNLPGTLVQLKGLRESYIGYNRQTF